MIFDDSNILAVAFLFEQARGLRLTEFELAEIDNANLDGEDAGEIASELMEFLRSEEDLSPAFRAGAYWALGKLDDERIIPFLQQALAKEVQINSHVTYQIMIGLDNLGESVFDSNRKSYSSEETELNFKDALGYLMRIQR